MAGRAPPLVFGEALVDAFPEALIPGGAPFNVACHLAALDLEPLLLSRIGADAGGAQLQAAAKRHGLRLDGVQHQPLLGTARVLVHEYPDGHVFEIPADLAFDHIDAGAALAAVATRLPPPDAGWLYHGTLALRSETSRAALAAVRSSRPFRVFVDLNWREAGPTPAQILPLLHDIDVLKLSETELTLLLGWLQVPAPSQARPQVGSHHPALAALAERTGARWILVTHGGDGAAVWSADGLCRASVAAPRAANLVDTVGAGDAFSARMLAALVCGQCAHHALASAVAFASASVGWRGAVPDDLSVYDGLLHPAARPPSSDPSAAA
ncbi:MAG: PfkB family carbohydrate kinase [Rhodanobacter sp.]|jgi:fructokinase